MDVNALSRKVHFLAVTASLVLTTGCTQSGVMRPSLPLLCEWDASPEHVVTFDAVGDDIIACRAAENAVPVVADLPQRRDSIREPLVTKIDTLADRSLYRYAWRCEGIWNSSVLFTLDSRSRLHVVDTAHQDTGRRITVNYGWTRDTSYTPIVHESNHAVRAVTVDQSWSVKAVASDAGDYAAAQVGNQPTISVREIRLDQWTPT